MYAGRIYTKSELHPEILFDPQADAGLRIDQQETERFKSIYALRSDLFFPFVLPVPTRRLFFMSNRIRYFLFADLGGTSDRDGVMRAYGGGINVPVGAQLTGVGNLSFVNLRLSAILERHYFDRIEVNPSFIFGIVGSF